MMITLRKTLLRTAFVLGVAAAGLTVAPHAMPAAQAAGPSLSATGQGGSVLVTGTGFTSGVTVWLTLLSSGLTLDLDRTPITPVNGSFQILLVENTSYSGGAYVAADQSGQASTTWAQTNIYPAPYITAQGGVGDVFVQGSGFAPGSTATVTVFQLYGCGFHRFCTKVLAVHSIPVDSFGTLNSSYGNELFYGLPSGQYVWVDATGTSIVTNATANSNISSVYVS
jgi:hypothetical protein